MKSAVQLFVLLACIFLCTSQNPIRKCRCIKTIPTVRQNLITDVKVYEPNPLCSKREVIVVRNDNKEFCLDLESNFTKRLLLDRATTTTTKSTSTTTTTAATTKSAATSSSVTRQ